MSESESASTTPKPTPPIPDRNLPVETYTAVAETDHSTSSQNDKPTATPIENHSKEAALTKINDNDDSRLSVADTNQPTFTQIDEPTAIST